MKKILISCILCLFVANTFAQSEALKFQVESYKFLYEVEDGKVIFSKIVEDIPADKNEIYNRVLGYFTVENTIESLVNIQVADKANGFVIGKGRLNIDWKNNLTSFKDYNCNHTLRVDIKDGRARLSLVVTDYTGKDDSFMKAVVRIPINTTYPIAENPKGSNENYGELFVKLCERTMSIFNEIEKGLRNPSKILSSDW